MSHVFSPSSRVAYHIRLFLMLRVFSLIVLRFAERLGTPYVTCNSKKLFIFSKRQVQIPRLLRLFVYSGMGIFVVLCNTLYSDPTINTLVCQLTIVLCFSIFYDYVKINNWQVNTQLGYIIMKKMRKPTRNLYVFCRQVKYVDTL